MEEIIFRTCPNCNDNKYDWGRICHRCRGKGKIAADDLSAPKKKKELYIRILHILAAYGPCTADEVYRLLNKKYPRPSVIAALRTLGYINNNLLDCEWLDQIPEPDEWAAGHSFESFEWENWSLNEDGYIAQRAYCPECLYKVSEHALGCSQPPPIKKIPKPLPLAIDSILAFEIKTVPGDA